MGLPPFCRVCIAQSLVFWVLFCRLFFDFLVFFLLAITFSVLLHIKASDYQSSDYQSSTANVPEHGFAAQSLVFCVVFVRLFFDFLVISFLAIVLSVLLHIKTYDYQFDIFKLFMKCLYVIISPCPRYILS